MNSHNSKEQCGVFSPGMKFIVLTALGCIGNTIFMHLRVMKTFNVVIISQYWYFHERILLMLYQTECVYSRCTALNIGD